MSWARGIAGGLAAFLWFCALVLLVVPPSATPKGADYTSGRCPHRAFEELTDPAHYDCRVRAADRVATIAELVVLATAASFGYLALAVRATRPRDA